MFEPSFYMLLSGRKRMVFGTRRIDFTAGRYAVAALGIPFMTQVTQASVESPYAGVELDLDPALIAALVLELPGLGERPAPGIDTALSDRELDDAVGRLLGLISRPDDAAVLAPLYERELCYRLLSGPVGGTLRQVVGNQGRFEKIRAAVGWITTNATERMRVEELAASVDMSVTSFHRHFKAVTGTSPLAYQRQVRLLTARERLLIRDVNVTSVAFESGYASTSQFSREYKQLFGVSPKHDLETVAQRVA